MFRYIAILILIIQVASAQIDGCFHENFNSAEQNEFSSACNFFSYPEWEFMTYGDETLAAPSTSASDGYIKTQSTNACIAKNLPLNTYPRSQIRVTYYATGSDTRLVLRLTFFAGLPADVFTVTPVLNTWTTAILTPSTTGSHSFYIIAYTSTGSVAVDSVTYVDNADDYEACAFLDSESSGPEQPQEPEESPEVPEIPEVPEGPENPGEPEDPGVPENPEVPEIPEEPENPVEPENPEVPETPENPGQPENPEIPENTESPENTEQTENPEETDPEITEVPDGPEAPSDPDSSGETNLTMFLSPLVTILLLRLSSYMSFV